MSHYNSECANAVHEKKLSIIIVSYNVKDHILSCLASIFENQVKWPLEVTVVDNNSQDGTVDAIREGFRNVTLVENDRIWVLPPPITKACKGRLENISSF